MLVTISFSGSVRMDNLLKDHRWPYKLTAGLHGPPGLRRMQERHPSHVHGCGFLLHWHRQPIGPTPTQAGFEWGACVQVQALLLGPLGEERAMQVEGSDLAHIVCVQSKVKDV